MKEHANNESQIVGENQLMEKGTINIWTPARIKKYLRKYSLGPGQLHVSSKPVKHRYYISDVAKAREEMIQMEPKDEHGLYINHNMRALQCEFCL